MSTALLTIDKCIAFLSRNESIKVNILCFGDSLTSGYLNNGRLHSPYSKTLKQMIETHYKYLTTLTIIECGVDGELMTNTMEKRLSDNLNALQFNIVILLGGTNDIGNNTAIQRVCKTLTKMYSLVTFQHKTECVAITIPPLQQRESVIRYQWERYLNIDRNKINQFIIEQTKVNSKQNAESKDDSDIKGYIDHRLMHLFDLYAHIKSLSNTEQKDFFDNDGLHFSQYGYCQFGKLVFHTIQPLLNQLLI
eukprot:239232_1